MLWLKVYRNGDRITYTCTIEHTSSNCNTCIHLFHYNRNTAAIAVSHHLGSPPKHCMFSLHVHSKYHTSWQRLCNTESLYHLAIIFPHKRVLATIGAHSHPHTQPLTPTHTATHRVLWNKSEWAQDCCFYMTLTCLCVSLQYCLI